MNTDLLIFVPHAVLEVLARWRKGLAIQASYHVAAQKQIHEDQGLPFHEWDKAAQEEAWLDRYWLYFDREHNRWVLGDGIGRAQQLVYQEDRLDGEWHSRCPNTGDIVDGPHTQQQAADIAEMMWTG